MAIDIKKMLNDALILSKSGQYENAMLVYKSVLKLKPKNAGILYRLGYCAFHMGDNEYAIKVFKQAVRYEPKNHIFLCALGRVYHEQNMRQEALQVLGKAVRLAPEYQQAFATRASVLAFYGDIDAAISDYLQAVRLDSTDHLSHKNMLYTMCLSGTLSETEIFNAHRQYAQTIAKSSVHGNAEKEHATPDKRLRVGYLSPDFRNHSVAYFIEPVIENHDCRNIEVYCYYDHITVDSTTDRIHQLANKWTVIAGLTDSQVFDSIQADNIDILVDLCGYTSNSRAGVLAGKPAPVQCEWLGYPYTTGLDSVDYWICDENVNPPGMTEDCYSESLLRLPDCFSCFRSTDSFPDFGTAPCLDNGYVTFGSFNNFSKVTPAVMVLWARILNQTKASRLLLKSECLADASQKAMILNYFKSVGVSRQRVELHGKKSSRDEHLEMYKRMDIALDTFPYNGTTTTLEALMMGVPVVTVSGDSHRSRVGTTLLKNIGAENLVGNSEDEYCEIACTLGRDVSKIANYRNSLRASVAASPLADARGFTKNLEAAYRKIWGQYCKNYLAKSAHPP